MYNHQRHASGPWEQNGDTLSHLDEKAVVKEGPLKEGEKSQLPMWVS